MKSHRFPMLIAMTSALIPATLAAAEPISAKDQAVLDRLETVHSFDCAGVPLAAFLARLQVMTAAPNHPGLTFLVDPVALRKQGLSLSWPVDLGANNHHSKRLPREPLQETLTRWLSLHELHWEVGDGVVKILGGDPKMDAIRAQLDRKVDLSFVQEPLEEVLKAMKLQSQGPGLENGIPIYIDPVGLQEAGATLATLVTYSAKGKPLKDHLRDLLRDLKLVHSVSDGMLTITREGSEDQPAPIAERNRARGGTIELGPRRAALEERLKLPVQLQPNPADEVVRDTLPLRSLLRVIRDATKSEELPDGVPFLVRFDTPEDAEKLLGVEVSRGNVEGAKLGAALNEVLKPHGMTFVIREDYVELIPRRASK